MQNSINQLYILFIFLISGVIIGILFDLFRVLRKSFITPDFVTYIEDILFWVITGLFLLYIIFKYSLGQIRIYMFISLLIGTILYFITISKQFIKLNVKIIKIIKVTILKIIHILIFPIKLILRLIQKVIVKPFSFITINIRKFCINFFKNLTKPLKNVNISNKSAKNKK